MGQILAYGIMEEGFEVGKILYSKSGRYQIQQYLGEGTFGEVARCLKLNTQEVVALKITRQRFQEVGKRELQILKKIKQNANKNNLLILKEHFTHQGRICMVFEMLDCSLFDLMLRKSLHLCEMRVILQQMLVALNALKDMGLVHADIKPDNIMLVNHRLKPFKVKLIDFGLCRPIYSIRQGCQLQAIGYRAPEIILGLPLSEAIDMWSLGCVMGFRYQIGHLYPLKFEYEVMRVITQMHGQPDDSLLNAGWHTFKYFTKDPCNDTWRLKTPSEYERDTGEPLYRSRFALGERSLDNLIRPNVCNPTVLKDQQAFLSLLKRMLEVDPKQRVKPKEALGHRFITMKHLQHTVDHQYMEAANTIIERSQLEQPSVEVTSFVTSSKVSSCTGSSSDLTGSGKVKTQKTLNKKIHKASSRTRAGSNDGPPAKAALDKTVDPGINKKLDVKEKDSSNPPDGIPTSNNEGNSGFVEVKTRRKWIMRIRKVFSRTRAGSNDGPPVKAAFDKTADPGINKKPDMNEKDSSVSPDGNPSNNDGGNSGFVEVKTRKKWIMRIRKVFSKSRVCCCIHE